MTLYDAFKVINLDEFNDTGLVSREVTQIFGSLGLKTVLVTKGNLVSILWDDKFLSLNLNDKNPFEFEGYAIFVDPANDLWIGTPHAT